MKKMTQANVQNALAGESQAHIRYRSFSERAKKDGLANIGRLFAAASASEQVHAGNYLKNLDGVKDTAANLAAAVEGETFEIEEMYPAYIAVAELQEEKKTLRPLQAALAAEKVHADLYRKAIQSATEGRDIPETAFFVCPVCGFTMEGEPPDVCPICGARHEVFLKF
jgi:rubrerythrin